MSKVRIGIRVSVRIRVSLVLVIEWGQDFPTWNEWSYMSGSRRVATTFCFISSTYSYVRGCWSFLKRNLKQRNRMYSCYLCIVKSMTGSSKPRRRRDVCLMSGSQNV